MIAKRFIGGLQPDHAETLTRALNIVLDLISESQGFGRSPSLLACLQPGAVFAKVRVINCGVSSTTALAAGAGGLPDMIAAMSLAERTGQNS